MVTVSRPFVSYGRDSSWQSAGSWCRLSAFCPIDGGLSRGSDVMVLAAVVLAAVQTVEIGPINKVMPVVCPLGQTVRVTFPEEATGMDLPDQDVLTGLG